MRATAGDRLHTHGVTSSKGEHNAEIIEVRGADNGPPYLVRFADGEERVIYPGPETVVNPREPQD
ncbi:hypothetical protein GCM10007079_51870 [Nocardiopsis terrae]|uniref:DUF1918 domain-containing protein n=1 Tax=Nocardiopsis terrae TaxID=372655 RepID=A0ABR9HAW7_9ACTN|nr:DUF1918 domain-containing protein [Nocardiopsis terrae]MBE1456162.1 hypothetical protein [Nocardiopsis terrae]GHC97952.1 hypothetical protein GCM10007079_51870 [Nocardiopsis terrae]